MTKQRRTYQFATALLAVALFMMLGGCSDDESTPRTSTVTDIQGNVYTTVVIGGQEWMAENLRTTKYRNGDDIPIGLSNENWFNTINTNGGAGAFQGTEMLESYGMVYNWYAVNDSRGICPEGWHVPSDAEWSVLINYVADKGYHNSSQTDTLGAGNALKSCRQVNSPLGGDCDTSQHPRWDEPDQPGMTGYHYGFDEFGFSGLPAGLRLPNGSFISVGRTTQWWTSTEDSHPEVAYKIELSYRRGWAEAGANFRNAGLSVRCIRSSD